MTTSFDEPYSPLALRAMTDAHVERLFDGPDHIVFVLERLARAAGQTNWFLLHRSTQLSELAEKLSPGSSVSLYADSRLGFHDYGPSAMAEILAIAHRDGDAVIGRAIPGNIALEVDFVSNEAELHEFTHRLAPGEQLLFGAFPTRENDGERAITLDLPDRDGVVRPHPH